MKASPLELSMCLGMFAVSSCTVDASGFDRGQPAPPATLPVLIGTLVDGDGHVLPRTSATIHCWTENSVVGGRQLVTDHEGRFRWELSEPFTGPPKNRRMLGLVGPGGMMAFLDARQGFSPGVHDIGDVLFARRGDSRALLRLSDDDLLARLDLLNDWPWDEARDACVRECARRGGQRIVTHLHQLASRADEITDVTLITACNRAARLADPLVLELVGSSRAPISGSIGALPVVPVAFVNRDPRQRRLRLQFVEGYDDSLAVDCLPEVPARGGYRLLRPRQGGLSFCNRHELAPGEQVVVPVEINDYLKVTAPGRYWLRVALRIDGSWGDEEELDELPQGILFLYSEPFPIDVQPAARGRDQRLDFEPLPGDAP